jgi:hypothetical protein
MVQMVFVAFVVGLASNAASPVCLAAERASHGVIFCSSENVSFTLAGRTTGGKYSIYDYRYQFLPHPSGVMHGGQRLIVFQGKSYVGNYMLPPTVRVVVRGTEVVLKGDKDQTTARADFSRRPPTRILVNGEVVTFDR